MRLDPLIRDMELTNTLTGEQVVAVLAELHVEQARLTTIEGALVTRLLALQAQPPPAEDALLDMPAVARLLGVPESRARELGRRGELPTTRIGKYVRVSRVAIEAFMVGNGIDRQGSRTLPSIHDAPRRGQTPPQTARPYPVEVRRAGRGAPRDRQKVGGGAAEYAPTDRAADSTAGRPRGDRAATAAEAAGAREKALTP
jgi:excisionase family DNA binding protein